MKSITREWRFYSLLAGLLSSSLICQLFLIRQQSFIYQNDHNHYFRFNNIQTERNAILEGTKAGLGRLTTNDIAGESHFILGSKNPVSIKVPRMHVMFQPHRSNETLNALTLVFFDQKKFFHHAQLPPNKLTESPLVVLLTPLLHAKTALTPLTIPMRLHQLKYKLFTYFQYIISQWQNKHSTFYLSKPIFSSDHVPFDKKEKLYQYNITQTSQGIKTVYYTPYTPNMSYPSEWISCMQGMCEYNWRYKGLWIQTLFEEHLLHQHQEIQKTVNRKLDKFMID